MITVPDLTKQFRQTNRSNLLGNIYTPMNGNVWSTFNIDFRDNIGAIRLGQRLKLLGKTGDTNLTNLGVPTAFTAFGGAIACFGGTRVFFGVGSSPPLAPDMSFTEDTSTGARTDWSVDTDDMCNFNGTLVAHNGNTGTLYSLNTKGGTWTSRGSTGAFSGTQLLYFRAQNRLYVMDYSSNVIRSFDTSWNISTSGNSYYVAFTSKDDGGSLRCIAEGSDRIWIGTKRGDFGGSADNSNPNPYCAIYEWDGISNQPTKRYLIPATGIMSIVMDKDIPIAMDTEGVLRKFNGQGFEEVGRLPLRRNESLGVSASPYWTQTFIHPRGLAMTKDGTVLALIMNPTMYDYNTATRVYENLQSGIWEFDLRGSASHKHSFSMMPTSSTSVTDYGQNRIQYVGSLTIIKAATVSAYGISSIYAGCSYYTDATNTKSGIFIDAPSPTGLVTYPEGQKAGYIAFDWMKSEQAKDIWSNVYLKYRQLLNSTDKIVGKYRTTEGVPFEISLTWTSTTTFTTATDLTSYVGYEMEVLQGTGSGWCSHIVSVTGPSAGLYTVTVDETYTGASTQTAKARIQNWTKMGSITDQASEVKHFPIGKTTPRIQIKLCFMWTGDNEVFELSVANKTGQPLI